MIPCRMSFFWAGPMSWLRYMTLLSFRRCNPDWEVRLYSPPPGEKINTRQWPTHETQDAEWYGGPDYTDRLGDLSIRARRWICPVASASPAQQCDLFQWDLLGHEGGFYADMDVLWLRPLDSLRSTVMDADAVFCLEGGAMAIGFMASREGGSRVFKEALSVASLSATSSYQACGTDAVYRMTLGRDPVAPIDTAGVRALESLRRKYADLVIKEVPSAAVYPFDWRQIEVLWEYDHLVFGEGTIGVHWFGGDPLSTRWNGLLTEQNYRQHDNTVTRCLRRILT